MGNTVPLETLPLEDNKKPKDQQSWTDFLSALVAAAFAAPAAKLPPQVQPYHKRSAGTEPEEYMADPRKRSAGAEPEDFAAEPKDYMEFNDYRSAYGYPDYDVSEFRKRSAGAEPEDNMADPRKRSAGAEPEDFAIEPKEYMEFNEDRSAYGYPDITDFRKRSLGWRWAWGLRGLFQWLRVRQSPTDRFMLDKKPVILQLTFHKVLLIVWGVFLSVVAWRNTVVATKCKSVAVGQNLLHNKR